MISEKFNTLGLSFTFSVPETAAEFDNLAKKEGACVASANSNEMYRGIHPQIRSLFLDALSSETKIERKTKETGKTRTIKEEGKPDITEAVVVWAETESDYFARVLAETKTDKTAYQGLLDSVAAGLKFDPSAAESAPSGPKKVAKKWLDAAQEVINAGAAERVAAALTTKLGLPTDVTLESLGRAIAEDQRRKSVAAEYV
tara:strand:- start:1153 stop:1755 length:603 start_codon:yes stop_codon:yes gene_type:complete